MPPYVFALLPERKLQTKLTEFMTARSETRDTSGDCISCIPITTVPRFDDESTDEESLLGFADGHYTTVILDANISTERNDLLVARVMGTPRLQALRKAMTAGGDGATGDDTCGFELIVGRGHNDDHASHDMPLRDFRREFLGKALRCDGIALCEVDGEGAPVKVVRERKL